MPDSAVAPSLNRLLSALPEAEADRLQSQCESVAMGNGDILCEVDRPYTHVLFPISGCISLVGGVINHPELELALIGEEGVLGATLVLGLDNAPVRAVVKVAGQALRVEARRFVALLARSPGLAALLKRYLYVSLAQLSQSVACARFHEIEPRLARSLLCSHDRAHADHFHFTHQVLAELLGVQRSAVTIAAGALQARGLIHYTRGEIRVLSRSGLEQAACECYQAAVSDYTQVFGEP